MKIVLAKREFVKKGLKLGVGMLSLSLVPKRLPVAHKIELRFSEPVFEENYGSLCREVMDLDKFRPIFAKFVNQKKLLNRSIKYSGQSSFITMYFDSQESLDQWRRDMKSNRIMKASMSSKFRIIG